MIFPFEITRKFQLPDKIFRDFSSDQIVDRIYENIRKESLIMIRKKNNIIKFKGDRSKIKFYKQFQWAIFTHCIDKGIVKIDDYNGQRRIIYTFQIFKYLIRRDLPPMILVLIISFYEKGVLLLFWFVLSVNLFIWLLIIVLHPTLVSEPIERIRYEKIRKKH